jgi:hypothetical protein
MHEPIRDRVKRLRNEIAGLSEADRKDKTVGQSAIRVADHERGLERLKAMTAELKSLTDWKECIELETRGGVPLNAHPSHSAGIVVYEFFPMRATGLARNLSGKTRSAWGQSGCNERESAMT